MPNTTIRKFGALGLALCLGLSLYAVQPGPAKATGLDEAGQMSLAEMRVGDMSKLVIHTTPRERIEAGFTDAEGTTRTLAEFAGKVVVVNFWATWCPPCRAEMPSIDRLAGSLDPETFEVLALSNDFGGLAKPKAFYEDTGVEHLKLYLDGRREVAREAAILGLPVTLLLDREGREIGRLVGDAEWDSPEAKALLARLAELTAPGA